MAKGDLGIALLGWGAVTLSTAVDEPLYAASTIAKLKDALALSADSTDTELIEAVRQADSSEIAALENAANDPVTGIIKGLILARNRR